MNLTELSPSIHASDDESAFSDDSDVKFETKVRYGNQKQVSDALIREFLADSSIQGFKYFFERKRHWSERVFWMIVFVIATYFSAVLIKETWDKWEDTPVIVSFSEKSTPVWAIPFPAVTICPETKAQIDKFNFTDTYRKILHQNHSDIPAETMVKMEAMSQLCDMIHEHFDFDIFKNVSTPEILNTLRNMSLILEETIFKCSWLYNSDDCEDDFKTIITEEGICFTFNALNSQDVYTDEVVSELWTVKGNPNVTHWDLEHGYDDSDVSENLEEIYPYRVLDSGIGSGLTASLVLYEKNFDYLCRGPVQGFKVSLHNPGEIPHVSKHFFRVPAQQEVLVAVKPNMITTSKNLQHYPPHRKQCTSVSEHHLRFFKMYTQSNCELECLSNFTRSECGCVPFSYPRDKDTPICDADEIECYLKAKSALTKKVFRHSLHNDQFDRKGCNCLPSCTSITYEAEVSLAKYSFKKSYAAFVNNGSKSGNVGLQVSKLLIAFKEQQFQTSKRSELYGLVDFLSNCGGILGLFIGVTALSFVEIFYYCTLRLYWTLRIYRFNKRNHSLKTSSALNN